jgi:hypothetical protein
VREIPTLSPQCPAALPLEGPPGPGPSVVCRVMEQEKERIKHGDSRAIHVIAAKNPNALFGFCCGRGLPVVDEVPEQGRGHHTACPVWRAEKLRIQEGRAMVMKPKERGSVTPFGLPAPGQTPADEMMDPDQIRRLAHEIGESVGGP